MTKFEFALLLTLPGDSLRPCFSKLTYCPRLFQWVSLVGSWQVVAGLGVPYAFCWAGQWWKMASFTAWPQHMPPGPAWTVTNHRSLCRSYEVALGQSQAAADLDLQWSPSRMSVEPTHLVITFRQQQSTTQLALQVAHQKAAKMGRKSNMYQMKGENSIKTIEWKGEKQSTWSRIQSTGYKIAQGT